MNYRVDPSIVKNLYQAEQDALKVKNMQNKLQRQSNVIMGKNTDKVLNSVPAYMAPHKS